MSERRLIILRHAKSEWPDGVADDKRPIAERGRQDAPAAGRWLRDNVGEIDLAVCSPALRARQTWDLAAAELPSTPRARTDDRVYDATPGDLLAVVQDLPDDARTVLLIGHNPGLSFLVSGLTGETHELKTSGIAVLGVDGAWSEVGSRDVELSATAKPRG